MVQGTGKLKYWQAQEALINPNKPLEIASRFSLYIRAEAEPVPTPLQGEG
jgi:hypothetical protein